MYWFLLRGDDDDARLVTPRRPDRPDIGHRRVGDRATTPIAGEPSSPESTAPPSSGAVTTTPEPAFVPFATTSEFPTLPQPIDIELVGTDLWVMSQEAGMLQRFDTTQPSPQAGETVDLGFTGDQGRNGSDVIPADGALYVTQYDAEAVAHVDLGTSPPTVTSLAGARSTAERRGARRHGVGDAAAPRGVGGPDGVCCRSTARRSDEPVDAARRCRTASRRSTTSCGSRSTTTTASDTSTRQAIRPTMTYVDGLEQPIDMLAVED